MDASETIDLTGAAYLVLDRNSSYNHTLPFSLSRGRQAVLVYDIESDGILLGGVGYPAVEEEVITNFTREGKIK